MERQRRERRKGEAKVTERKLVDAGKVEGLDLYAPGSFALSACLSVGPPVCLCVSVSLCVVIVRVKAEPRKMFYVLFLVC